MLERKKITKKLRILFVDDHESIRQSMGILLKRRAERYFEARNGREALELLQKESVDVILTDLNMPELNGIELARAIRKEEKEQKRPKTYIIVTSAYRKQDAPETADKTLFDYSIYKPVMPPELFAALEQITLEKEEDI